LSPEAARFLAWLNEGIEQSGWNEQSRGRVWGFIAVVHRVIGADLRMDGTPPLLPDLTWLEQALPPLPFRLEWEPNRSPHFVPNYDKLDDRGRLLYGFVALLEDQWSKGVDRLKPCQWPGCLRWFWDPTTTKQKRFCEGRHDKERARARAAQHAAKKGARKMPGPKRPFTSPPRTP